MRVIAACALAAGTWCALAIAPVAAQTPARPSADEQAVRAVVAAYVEAREKQDPAAIGALFTADADQVNSAGEWRRGREAIVRGTLQSSQRNAGSRRIAIRAVRFLAPDMAIVDGDYEIGTPGASAQRLWTTLVVVRVAEGWRIAAIRNSRQTGGGAR